MSAQAQRIVASHKEAAKRATEYLQGARNLKLKHAEALELVARVLGVANWQTLNEMAAQGRAPRAEQPAGTTAAPADARKLPIAERLALWYSEKNGWGDQHPHHSRDEWAADRSQGRGARDYWEWVHDRMSDDKAMLPWNHETHPDVLIARAGGVDVDFDGMAWDTSMSPNEQFADLPPCASEVDCWKQAAEAVAAVAATSVGSSKGMWATVDLNTKLDIVRRGIPKTWKSGQVSPEKEGLRFGELPAEERLLNEDVTLCQALGVTISPTPAFTGDARGPWTDHEGRHFRTEAEGWATRALLARQSVTRQGLASVDLWEGLPADVKVELALKALKPVAYAKKYGAMLAEQRHESVEVAIARAADIDVFRKDGAWRVAGGAFGGVFIYMTFRTELEAWECAAEKAWARVIAFKGLQQDQVHAMPGIARVLIVKDAMKTLKAEKTVH